MKHFATKIAVVLGLISTIIANPNIITNHAKADQLVANPVGRVISSLPVKLDATGKIQANQRDIIEINFTVRAFLWALNHRQPKILSMVAAQQLQEKFANSRLLMVAMNTAHAPVVGAKEVFLHTPDIDGNHAVQAVFLSDRRGIPWRATYQLSKNLSGRYGITDCTMKMLSGAFS